MGCDVCGCDIDTVHFIWCKMNNVKDLNKIRKVVKSQMVEHLNGSVNRNRKISIVIDKLNEVIDCINDLRL